MKDFFCSFKAWQGSSNSKPVAWICLW